MSFATNEAWQNDPIPTYLHMYAFSGTHPNTGRQFRFIQGINLTYVPRQMRKQFASEWVNTVSKSKNLKFTYEKLKARFPYMKIAIRRYFYSPKYYIKNLREIPLENMEKVIIGSWSKDFSKKAMIALVKKYKRGAKLIKGRMLRSIFGRRL